MMRPKAAREYAAFCEAAFETILDRDIPVPGAINPTTDRST
jgi:hypothetical protein